MLVLLSELIYSRIGINCVLRMPDALVYQALKMLPDWMAEVSERFDDVVNKIAQHQ